MRARTLDDPELLANELSAVQVAEPLEPLRALPPELLEIVLACSPAPWIAALACTAKDFGKPCELAGRRCVCRRFNRTRAEMAANGSHWTVLGCAPRTVSDRPFRRDAFDEREGTVFADPSAEGAFFWAEFFDGDGRYHSACPLDVTERNSRVLCDPDIHYHGWENGQPVGVELVLRGVGPSDYIPFDTERSNSVVILGALCSHVVVLYVWSSPTAIARSPYSTFFGYAPVRESSICASQSLDEAKIFYTGSFPDCYDAQAAMYGMDAPCREAEDALFLIKGTFKDGQAKTAEKLVVELHVPFAVWGRIAAWRQYYETFDDAFLENVARRLEIMGRPAITPLNALRSWLGLQ